MSGIVYVRANFHDSTAAIPRALEAGSGLFETTRILCWDRTRSNLPRIEIVDGVEIRRFKWAGASRSLTILFWLFCYQLWLSYHLLRIRPKVIQFLDFESMVPSCFIGLCLGATTIYDMRDPFAYCYNFPMVVQRIAYAIDWIGMALCSAFIIPLEERRPYLGRWGRGKKPVEVILNVCPDELETLAHKSAVIAGNGRGRVKIGYLGYLSPSRAGFILIDLCNEYSDRLELYVAGTLRFRTLLDQIHRNPHLHFLGHLPRPDALALMRDVDVISLLSDPSLPGNWTLAPNKFYEALSVGTPVLVERQMSISRSVEENGLGWVVDYGNMEQLKDVVQDLHNTDRLAQIRRRCREFYLTHFSYDRVLAKYREFYELLLNKN